MPAGLSPSDEVLLLDGILRYLALALENVRLRAFDISAFRELSLFPADARTIEEICERILARITMLFPSEACCLATVDKATESLEIRASYGMKGDDGGSLGDIASKQPESGPVGPPAISLLGPEDTLIHFPSAAAGTEATTAIAFMNAQESYVGAIVLVLKPDQELTDQRQLLLASLASQAALVIRSADLFISSQEMVVQEERSRIAREIHDGVAQNLALLMIKMEIISRLATKDPARMNKELENVMSVLESSVHELRRSIYALRSPDLARLGLLPALKRLTRDFMEQTNIDVSLILPSSLSLSPQSQSAVFSVVQERLDAVARDGSATEVALSLATNDGNLDVHVQDNGRQMRPTRDTSSMPAWQARLTDRIRPLRWYCPGSYRPHGYQGTDQHPNPDHADIGAFPRTKSPLRSGPMPSVSRPFCPIINSFQDIHSSSVTVLLLLSESKGGVPPRR